jgi:hypothetical protein
MAKPSKESQAETSTPSVTEKVPLVPFKVIACGIPFYLDKGCTQQVANASIVILQTLDPEDEIQELDIVPSTKIYQPGDYVTLAFDNKKIWEDCYFRDPESGETSRAWRIQVNFIGELISPQSIEKDRTRITELEKGVQAKIEEIARRGSKQPPVN